MAEKMVIRIKKRCYRQTPGIRFRIFISSLGNVKREVIRPQADSIQLCGLTGKELMKKQLYVEQMQEGARFEDIFMVKSAKIGETRAGKPYLVLSLMDSSGEISGPIWDNAQQIQPLCQVGNILLVRGTVNSYRDKLQLKIDQIENLEKDQIDLQAFFPASPRCRHQMSEDLQALIRTVANPFIRKLLNYFFESSDYWKSFQQAPAAKGIHHAYLGGLLEHCLSVARLADYLSGHYEGVDRSLLLAGALLHDIGKLEELQMENGVVEYSVGGRLKGHLAIGSELVGMIAATIKDFPRDLLEQLQHLILSHHGRREFGSPTVPMTVEALLLSYIDDMDSKMNVCEQLRRKMNSEEMSWSEYQRSLERYLYLGGFKEQQEGGQSGEKTTPSRQPSLF